MTSQQKAKVHQQLDAAGVFGEGMTRANERRAVIEAAGVLAQPTSASNQPWTGDAGAVRQHATDIGAHAARQEILLLEIFDKLDGMHPTDGQQTRAVDAIECFATCALRNAVLMREASDSIEKLTLKGGAA